MSGMTWHRCWPSLAWAAVAVLCLLPRFAAGQDTARRPSVLMLFITRASMVVSEQRAFEKTLVEQLGFPVEFHVEYLELPLREDLVYRRALVDFLIEKYSARRIDLVLVTVAIDRRARAFRNHRFASRSDGAPRQAVDQRILQRLQGRFSGPGGAAEPVRIFPAGMRYRQRYGQAVARGRMTKGREGAIGHGQANSTRATVGHQGSGRIAFAGKSLSFGA